MQADAGTAHPGTARPPCLFTTKDLTRILRLGEATVRTLIHSGALPALKIGVEWRVTAQDLDAFLEARKTTERSAERDGRRGGRKPGPRSSRKE